MANPQKENGFTAISNEIMEQLAILRLSPSEWQVLLVVFRQTYGWKKRNDFISLSQLERKTGRSHRIICSAKKKLVKKMTLLETKNGLSFNKNYDEWVVKKTSRAKNISEENMLLPVKKTSHTKETNTKESECIPPTREMVERFCHEEGFSIDADYFLDFYTARGWMIGKNKMKNWQATIRYWVRKDTPKEPPEIVFLRLVTEKAEKIMHEDFQNWRNGAFLGEYPLRQIRDEIGANMAMGFPLSEITQKAMKDKKLRKMLL